VNRSLHSLSLSRLFPLSPSPTPSRSHSGRASLLSTVDHFITGFTDAQVARLNARAGGRVGDIVRLGRFGVPPRNCAAEDPPAATLRLRMGLHRELKRRLSPICTNDLRDARARLAGEASLRRRLFAEMQSRDRLSPDNKNSARSGGSIIDLRTTQSSKSGGARVGRVLRYPRRNRQDSNQIGCNLYPIK